MTNYLFFGLCVLTVIFIALAVTPPRCRTCGRRHIVRRRR